MSSTTERETETSDKDIAIYFDCDYQNSSPSSTATTFPHYSRSNWDGVELPRNPSLRLVDDAIFFQLLCSNYHQTSVVPKQTSIRNQILAEQAEKEDTIHKKKHTPVPIHIRKLEIELVQRKLPRYPSKTHRTEACFYPLRSSPPSSLSDNEFDNTQKKYRHILSASSQHGLSTKEPNDDGSFSSNEDDDFTIEENEHLSTEEPSEEEEEEIILSQMNEYELQERDINQAQNIEYTDEEEHQRRIEVSTPFLASSGQNEKSFFSSTSPSPPIIPEQEEAYEIKIGVVPTSLQAMIFQAQLELRCRKVPEEHKSKYKLSLMEAILIGRNTRLNEYTVEAYGTQCEKYKPSELPSDTWVKGQEYVTFPKINNNPNPVPFTIFNEAVALGGIKALKPKITTNYDIMFTSSRGEDIDVDDMNKHKLIRTMYLTEMYLHREFRENNIDNDEIEQIHYESLDDVILPTNQYPVFKHVTQEMTDLELKETIAQQVAEKVWERRYRLERPRAKQRIRSHCRCIYCKTTNPYQTLAYRKKWLIQQGLWKEPQIEQEECNTAEDITYEVHLPSKDDPENKHDEIICVSTRSNSPLAQLGSDSFHIESVSSGFDSENSYNRKDINVSIEDINRVSMLPESLSVVPSTRPVSTDTKKTLRKDINVSIENINRVSMLPESLSVVPATRPASTDTSGKTRVNQKKTLVGGVKKILNLSRHGDHSTASSTRRLRQKRSRNQRMIKNRLNSMRSLFGPSSHGREKYP